MRLLFVWTLAATASSCVAGDFGRGCVSDEDCADSDAPLCDATSTACSEAECTGDEQCRAERASQSECYDDEGCQDGERCADAVHGSSGEYGACLFVATSCDGGAVLTAARRPLGDVTLFEFCSDPSVTCDFPRCAP